MCFLSLALSQAEQQRQSRTPLELAQMERSTHKNPFFMDLDSEQKSVLFEGMVVEEHKPGAVIIQQGDSGAQAEDFYIIKSGEWTTTITPTHLPR